MLFIFIIIIFIDFIKINCGKSIIIKCLRAKFMCKGIIGQNFDYLNSIEHAQNCNLQVHKSRSQEMKLTNANLS